MAQLGSGGLELSVDNVVKAFIDAGVVWTKEECKSVFDIPEEWIDAVANFYPTNEERLRISVQFWLSVDPSPSWKRVIALMDYWIDKPSAASKMYQYAESATDPTFTPENVKAVLENVKNLPLLCRNLRVPDSKNNDRDAIVMYWMSYTDQASWIELAGSLYSMQEEEALVAVKKYLSVQQDPSLTEDNLCSILEGVMEWYNLASGWGFNIPTSELDKIKEEYANDDVKCAKAAWSFWLKTHPAPSWACVAEALYRSFEHEVLKKLEMKYPIVITPARRLAACRLAIKEKGFIEEIIAQGILCGFPRSGKTSFKDRLVGRFRKIDVSTGVADKVVRIEISRSLVLAGEYEWIQLDSVSDATATVAEKITLSIFSERVPIIDDSSMHLPSASKKPRKKPASSTSSISVTPSSDTSPPLEFIKSANENLHLPSGILAVRTPHKIVRGIWTHYLSDVGGQLEFQELYPNLLSGLSLLYYFFRADQDLNTNFPVEYRHSNGESMVPFKASMTGRDAILQFLASVSSIASLSLPEGKIQVQPKVIFIATHIDLLESDDKIIEIDTELQKIVKITQAYKDGMIVHASESCMLFPINNLSTDETGFQKVRTVIERVVTGSSDYCIKTPYTWSIFSVAIQQYKEQVLPYSTCLEVGKECGIDTQEEMDNCLWFLHNITGVLRHYPDVPNVPELRDVVFKDPQYIFDKVTDLVVNTFTFENVGNIQRIQEKFAKKGIFSDKILRDLPSDFDILPTDMSIKLLEHLRIIAPLKKDDTDTQWFLPCALVHADTQTAPDTAPRWLPPLLFTFNSGYCPKGLFGTLVADLLQLKPELNNGYEWEFNEDQIFRNQICFSVGPYIDRFRFTVSSTYIKIEALPNLEILDRQVSLATVFCHVQHTISSRFVYLTKKLNYVEDKVAYKQAFYCPNTTCSEITHSSYVMLHKGVPCTLKCSITNRPVSFPKGYQIWFDESFVIPAGVCAETAVHSNSSVDVTKFSDDLSSGDLYRYLLFKNVPKRDCDIIKEGEISGLCFLDLSKEDWKDCGLSIPGVIAITKLQEKIKVAQTKTANPSPPVSAPDYQVYVSSLPPCVYPLLEQQLDWDHGGVDTDLNEIADHMLDWEERLSAHLGLEYIAISDIKKIYLTQPLLQRREALRRWRNRCGLHATYGNLLKLCVEAGHTECAQAICDILKRKESVFGGTGST